MGVPALFRWLSQKYPKVTSQVIEEQPREINGHSIPVDASKVNPNGVEFDNLYLDMNGIIHPCCHPEGKPAPATEEEMFVEIFKYIDRIMAMIRPRKVLYMAIDGVAPRAKMNQQRSRRFRAAQEAQIQQEEEERIRKEWEAAGDKMPETEKKQHFDSNCITPGTPFMTNLAVALRYYVADRLNTDPGWRNLKVILSDASVPGEGEHKIMDYIRRQRGQTGYDPNTHHVLYGLDADLIMLALATHEPNFQILREDVFFNDAKDRGCFICGQTGHQANECTGKKKEKIGEFDEKGKVAEQKPFVFLHVSVLREYLEIELKSPDLPFAWDLERAIDDWVFLCFFVGNDFLPHLPSLEIREGAIDRLIELWRKNLPKWGSYLTDSGDIDLQRVELMMDDLGKVEDDIFRERRHIEERRREGRIRRNREREEAEKRRCERMDAPPAIVTEAPPDYLLETLQSGRKPEPPVIPSRDANKAAAEALKIALTGAGQDGTGNPAVETQAGVKRKADAIENETTDTVFPVSTEVQDISDSEEDVTESKLDENGAVDGEGSDETPEVEEEVEETMTVADVPIPHEAPVHKPAGEEEEPHDDVRLWESGWKQRYYKNKFDIDETDVAFRRRVVTSYVEGLCWVLKYYYQGCQSWKWYFPYHYAPFASDFDFVGELNIVFELGTPFRPVEQLMGVLPAYSRQHIPPAFQSLMTDSESPIIDFYPEKFPIDLNGKKFSWQGVALLPFIEENRLLQALETRYHLLTEEEVQRNSKGDEILVVGGSHGLFEPFCSLYGRQAEQTPIPIDARLSQKFFGSVLPDPNACLPGSTFESPLSAHGLDDISNNHSISVLYYMPEIAPGHIFKAESLPGAQFPSPVLDANDVYAVRMGYNGRRGRGRGRGGAAGRFIRHGMGPGNTFGRQGYDNGAQSYDGRRNDYQHDSKRSRYDSRSQHSGTGLPYMGGGGHEPYSSGSGAYQQGGNQQYGSYQAQASYGGGYIPNASSGYQQNRGYQGGSTVAPPGVTSWNQTAASNQSGYNRSYGPPGAAGSQSGGRPQAGNLGWSRNVSANRGSTRGSGYGGKFRGGNNRRNGNGNQGGEFKPY
ncbi:hypothetical protein SpCBS45565_g02905 [Spizellomyces sp. 'palustris']|nr:hypothetical protein SpCBS45565_g02905 [Spizellomyces sp. 'palustris']